MQEMLQQIPDTPPHKNWRKPLLIILAVVLVLAVAGAAVAGVVLAGHHASPASTAKKSVVTKPKPAPSSAQYSNSAAGLKITPPPGWDAVTPQANDVVDFQAPQTEADGTRAYISVVATPAQGSTLDELLASVQNTTSTQLQNYKSLGVKSETVGGQSADLVSYSFTANNRNLVNQVLLVIKDGTAYSLTGVNSAASAADQKAIQAALLSLQI